MTFSSLDPSVWDASAVLSTLELIVSETSSHVRKIVHLMVLCHIIVDYRQFVFRLVAHNTTFIIWCVEKTDHWLSSKLSQLY